MIEFAVPVPPAILSPNARPGHWSQRSRAAKQVRESAAWHARSIAPEEPYRGARVQLVFTFPTAHRRDKDNLLARCKAIFDGIADGGIVADDSYIAYEPVVVRVERGCVPSVRVVIRPDDPTAGPASAVPPTA